MSARISSAVARPLGLELGRAADPGELRRAVERHPAHQLRRDIVLRLAARLPDPLVGLAPHARRALGLALDDRPQPPRQPLAAARVHQHRVEHGAEHVVLALVEGAVADPHRPRARVPGEVVARALREVAAPVDPVHDLQRAVLVGLDVGDELHELVGLPVEVQPMQRPQRERGVAHPGIAVVPVALAARRLRQGGREGGDGGAGRHVGQALDRQRGAQDRLPPALVGDPRPPDPRPPEVRGRVEPRDGIGGVGRRREALGPGQRAEQSARPRAACGARGRGRPRSRAPCRSAAGSSGRRPRRRPRGGRRRPVTTRRSRARSRTRARRSARPPRCPRCRRRSARAGARRRRPPAAACAG